MGGLVGRSAERAAIARTLDAAASGPAVALIDGVAGVGKSELWRAGCEDGAARGMRVVTACPAASERGLAYAGLADLIGPLYPSARSSLPGPQRVALESAVLRTGDESAVAVETVLAATTALLAASAPDKPLAVAVDDVQWLDTASRRALRFALRRLDRPTALLAAHRRDDSGEPSEFDAEIGPQWSVTRIPLGPLSDRDIGVLVRRWGGHTRSPGHLRRAVRLAGGHPLFARELVRQPVDDADRLPESLDDLLGKRLLALPERVRLVLCAASAAHAPTVELLAAAVGDDAGTALEAAETAGIVSLGDQVRFTHPLLAAASYQTEARTRRDVHRWLARVVDDEEDQARHLALATVGLDEPVALRLDAAASSAAARGAPDAAVELSRLALDHAPTGPRRFAVARFLTESGAYAEAEELLAQLVPLTPAGAPRAGALALLAQAGVRGGGSGARSYELLEEALRQPGLSDAELAALEVAAGYSSQSVLPLSHGVEHLRRGLAAAQRSGHEQLTSAAFLTVAVTDMMMGHRVDAERLARVAAVKDAARQGFAETASIEGLIRYAIGDYVEATTSFAEAHRDLRDCGMEGGAAQLVYFHPAALLALGRTDEAATFTEQEVARAELGESALWLGLAICGRAAVRVRIGDEPAARSDLDTVARIEEEGGDHPSLRAFRTEVSGELSLSLGDARAAEDQLQPHGHWVRDVFGYRHTGANRFWADLAEAHVACGHIAEAEDVIGFLERSGHERDEAWSTAVGARGRALLLARAHEFDAADAAIERSLEALTRLGDSPYDRARTHLAWGRIHRRNRRRGRAAAEFAEAERLLAGIGAHQWVRRARDERGRALPADRRELSPTEQRIAELATSGLTIREIAAAAFVSPKTVEANISRIYRKLAIRSRAELGAWVSRRGSSSAG